MLEDIKQAYDEGLVDPGFIGFDNVKRDMAMGKDRILTRLADNSHRRLVDDTAAEMGWWACFREGSRNGANSPTEVSSKTRPKPDVAASQIIRAEPKIGRNERCPCGSGKKYKTCCGA